MEMDFSDVTMEDNQTDSDDSFNSWNNMQSVVSWQSSQPSNPALNLLMSSTILESKPAFASSSRVAWQKSVSLETIPGYSSPLQSGSKLCSPSPSNVTPSGRPSTSRPHIRPRNPGERSLSRTSSEQTIPILSEAGPLQFMDLVKGVSESLNESAGIPTRSIAGPSVTRVARNRNKDRRPSERRAAVHSGPLRKPTLGRVFSADSRLPSAAEKGKCRAVEVRSSMEGLESVAGSGPTYTGQRGECMLNGIDNMIAIHKEQNAHGSAISSEAITTFPRTFSQTQMPPPMGLPSKHPPTDQASRNRDMALPAPQPVLPPTQRQHSQTRHFKPEDKPMKSDPVPKLHPLLQKQALLPTQARASHNSVFVQYKCTSNTNLSRGIPSSVISPLPSTPTLSSTPSSRPPALGMKRHHDLSAKASAGVSPRGGLATRQKAFKPPLLSQPSTPSPSQSERLPRHCLPEKCVTIASPGMSSASSNSPSLSGHTQSSYSSSGTVSTPSGSSTLRLPAIADSKSERHSKKNTQVASIVHPIPQTPPLPEPADGDPDSSFGNMSFDMDALEETMKMYD